MHLWAWLASLNGMIRVHPFPRRYHLLILLYKWTKLYCKCKPHLFMANFLGDPGWQHNLAMFTSPLGPYPRPLVSGSSTLGDSSKESSQWRRQSWRYPTLSWLGTFVNRWHFASSSPFQPDSAASPHSPSTCKRFSFFQQLLTSYLYLFLSYNCTGWFLLPALSGYTGF